MAINLNEVDLDTIKPAEETDDSSVQDTDLGKGDGKPSDIPDTSDDVDGAVTDSDDPDKDGDQRDDDDSASSKPDNSGDVKDDVDLDAILKERTDGQIESFDSITEIIKERDQLREASKVKPKLEFPNERAEKAYEFILEHQGEFAELSQQQHQVLALGEPEKLDPKQAMLEAFLLERSDLPRSKGENLFNARYEKLYGEQGEELEGDILLQDEHDMAHKSAIETIRKMQDGISATKEPETKDEGPTIDVAKEVDRTLQEYGGLELSLGEKGEDSLTISLEDDDFKGLEAELKQAMVNPNSYFEKKLEEMKGKDGNFDYDAYANLWLSILGGPKMVDKAYSQGFTAGQTAKLKESKHASDSKSGDMTPAAKQMSKYDGLYEAQQAKRK